MEYIRDDAYAYIMSKYHDPADNDPHRNRFIRRDGLFSPDSGLSAEDVLRGVRETDQACAGFSHPIRKARVLAFLLAHTRISCDPRDPFPAINMVDRPLNATIIGDWRREVFGSIIPDVEQRRAALTDKGVATIWPDFDHSVPHWDRLFALGLRGILRESEEARAAKADLTPEQRDFYDSIRITYEALLAFLSRLEVQAVRQGSHRMARALAGIRDGAPHSFYEALLLDYLYFMISEHIDGLQVRSLCNFDRLLDRFCRQDLENGVSEEQLRSDLAHFLLQFTAIGNYWNQPVYLGGCREDESTQINELSYRFLDVYDRMGIYNPKIQIKVADSTPKDFLLRALDMIRRGRNCIVFVGDATIRRALEKAGIPPEQARLCDVKGCYEYAPRGALGAGMNYVNLLKPLEYALHGGCDGVTGEPTGLACPPVESIDSFDALLCQYKRQLAFVIDQVIEVVNGFEDYLTCINPQPMLSATYPACIASGRDAMGGGALTNNSGIMFGFMADIADSLSCIKKFVFDRGELTLSRLRDALDRNFEGDERLRLALRADPDKYGNNRELPDSIARDLADFVCSRVCGRPNAPLRGGKWNLGFHVARQSYTQAPLTAASPNGRRRGEELSKNLSASMGMNREGATAAILSTTKIDATAFTSDACLDLGLLPSAVRGEEGLAAMYALLVTFLRRGGHAMHINVFDADTLRRAQREPEKYRDLQIRVCGWNVLFNNINKTEQDGFIRQAEALV